MILIAIGSNLPAPDCATPLDTVRRALDGLEGQGIRVLRRSRWYRSAPLPPSGQPEFINGVVAVETVLGPAALLAELHALERRFGRIRAEPNAARSLDLDLIDHDGLVHPGPDAPVLPHPRMEERAFVLLPLADVAPDWRHPATGKPLETLIAALPPDQRCDPLSGESD